MAGSISNLNAVFDRMDVTDQGYSQSFSPTDGRWSYLDQAILATLAVAYSLTRALSAIIPGRAQDCSSGCLGGAKLAGFDVNISGMAYTGNAAELLRAAGFTILRWAGMSSWKPGDFLVVPGAHMVYCRDATHWWSAESNELGTATGGKPGDQTGNETRYRAPYDISRGGARTTYICRPPAEVVVADPLVTTSRPKADLLVVDGQLGPLTYGRLQRFLGLPVTRVFDDATKHKLQRYLDPALGTGPWGAKSTRALQKRVGASVDGDWGRQTTTKLQEWLNTEARKTTPEATL